MKKKRKYVQSDIEIYPFQSDDDVMWFDCVYLFPPFK